MGSTVIGTNIPEISQIGYSSMLASAFALRMSTNVDASSRPNMPSATTQTTAATTNATGCAKSSRMP